jgi:hypothetical protein
MELAQSVTVSALDISSAKNLVQNVTGPDFVRKLYTS